jgi:hypothetical protein
MENVFQRRKFLFLLCQSRFLVASSKSVEGAVALSPVAQSVLPFVSLCSPSFVVFCALKKKFVKFFIIEKYKPQEKKVEKP